MRKVILLLLTSAICLLALTTLVQADNSAQDDSRAEMLREHYDFNDDGVIDADELLYALIHYLSYYISEDDLHIVLKAHLGLSERSLEPQPTHTPYPTYTARPTYTPYPTAIPLPTPTPYPTYTPYPSPTPTLVPTKPIPTATPAPLRPVQCRHRTVAEVGPGWGQSRNWGLGRFVVTEVSRHLEVTVTNPATWVVRFPVRGEPGVVTDDHVWRYSLTIVEEGRSKQAAFANAVRLEIARNGEWSVRKGGRVVQSGYLDEVNVPIYTEEGETNVLTFYTKTPEMPYRFLVNGVALPIDFSTLLPFEYERYNEGRLYSVDSEDIVDFIACAENAW